MRLASTGVIAKLVDYAHHDLDRTVALWPLVAEQKLLGGLPAANCDTVPEDEARARHGIEGRDRKAQLVLLDALDRLARHAAGVEDALRRIGKARVALGGQAPAVDAALNAHRASANRTPNLAGVGPDGRLGTSGVSLEEADRQRRGAVEAETACVCCELGVSQVGRLKAGLCKNDYDSWWRAGFPDRAGWLVERRQFLDRKTVGEAEIVALRVDPAAYKTLREVA